MKTEKKITIELSEEQAKLLNRDLDFVQTGSLYSTDVQSQIRSQLTEDGEALRTTFAASQVKKEPKVEEFKFEYKPFGHSREELELASTKLNEMLQCLRDNKEKLGFKG